MTPEQRKIFLGACVELCRRAENEDRAEAQRLLDRAERWASEAAAIERKRESFAVQIGMPDYAVQQCHDLLTEAGVPLYEPGNGAPWSFQQRLKWLLDSRLLKAVSHD